MRLAYFLVTVGNLLVMLAWLLMIKKCLLLIEELVLGMVAAWLQVRMVHILGMVVVRPVSKASPVDVAQMVDILRCVEGPNSLERESKSFDGGRESFEGVWQSVEGTRMYLDVGQVWCTHLMA